MKKSLKDWTVATRPWSFTASALSVVTALAYLEWSTSEVDWMKGIASVAAIILFHAAGNTWSDWHDFRHGVDAADTYGVKTITGGLFTPDEIRNLSLCLFAAASAAGLGMVLVTGWPLLWIGLAGFLCAVCYPPLKYHALGDVVILLAYGLLPALGASYAATGEFHTAVLWAAFPVSLLVDAILHANNTRDMRTDRRAGIRTLSHGLGVRGSVMLYVIEMVLPFVWVAALVPFGIFPVWSLAVLLLSPLAFRNARAMCGYRKEEDAEKISSHDQLSAQLQLLFCLVLTLSLFADEWIR